MTPVAVSFKPRAEGWKAILTFRSGKKSRRLVERLSPEDRKSIAAMSDSDLIKLHHGYGTSLRNQFRRNEYPHLFRFCSAKVPSEILSFDAVSEGAIRLIWLNLRSG